MTMTETQLPADKWLDRVQALLAKADSTPFPEEAEAFVFKAQELMARHSIDEAMLAKGGKATDQIVNENISIPAPYATAKSCLLNVIAIANDCSVVRLNGKAANQTLNITGYSSDVESVKMLFGKLATFAVSEMSKTEIPAWESARAFRHAFMVAFANHIDMRLGQARAAAVTAHEEETGSTGTALVLADRKREVNENVKSRYGRLRSTRTTTSSGAGAHHGSAAGDRAKLGESVTGGRRELGR